MYRYIDLVQSLPIVVWRVSRDIASIRFVQAPSIRFLFENGDLFCTPMLPSAREPSKTKIFTNDAPSPKWNLSFARKSVSEDMALVVIFTFATLHFYSSCQCYLDLVFFENSIILKSSCSHDWVEKLYCQENLQSHLCPKSVLFTSELFIPNIETLNCSKAFCFGLISFPSPFHHRGVLVPFTPIVSNSHLQSTTIISMETF